MSERTLIATVGLPYSGKTTWAREQGVPIVNPDSIRLALHGQRYVALAEPYVWAIAKTMVQALFLAGHDRVILDATNLTAKRRAEWWSTDWTLEYRVMCTPASVCIERAWAAGDEEIVSIIERMAATMELPCQLTERTRQ